MKKIILIIILIVFILMTCNTENFDNIKDNITVVSGFWNVKHKYDKDSYDKWFKNTLKINQRYIFFCEKDMQPIISKYRENLETNFIEYKLSDFYANNFNIDQTHPIHVPSIELGRIWNEKVHLIKLAKDSDSTKTDFYVWVDAGITPFRNQLPPPVRLNLKDVNSLPHDKLCYSEAYSDYHAFSAGVLIIHRDFIDKFHDIYYKIVKRCSDSWKCGSDQYNFTLMKNEYPDMFYKMSFGYGENLLELYRLLE